MSSSTEATTDLTLGDNLDYRPPMTDRGSSVDRALSYYSKEVGGLSPSPGTRTDPSNTQRDRWRNRHIRWGEWVGLPSCPYLRRWVIEFPSHFSIRLHHFISSDDDRAFHDHPWWFVTLVLRGSYVDWSPSGKDRLTPGSIRYRPAHHSHTVLTEGAWTLVVTGPKMRLWGFRDHETGRWFKANKWFFTRGHHPCS